MLALLLLLTAEAPSDASVTGETPPADRAFDLADRQTLYRGGEGGYAAYRIPVLAESPGGALLAFCEARKNGASDQGDIDLVVRRSTDGGANWSPMAIVHEVGGEAPITIGNPCPIRDAESGTLHLLFTQDNKRLFATRSDDDGATWADPVEHSAALSGFDYDVVRIATGPVKGLRLPSGRLVAPVWMSNRELEDKEKNSTANRFRSGTLISDDDGRTWQAGGIVPATINRLNECTIVTLPGTPSMLLMNARTHDTGYRALSVSHDGGESWSAPLHHTGLEDPTCQGSMIALPGYRLLFSNVHRGVTGSFTERRRGLGLKLSTDDGWSWTSLGLIEPKPSAYSDLLRTKNGQVLCLFECGERVYRERIDVVRIALHDGEE